MKSILLIGLGRFGRYSALKLAELGHQVMAVDRVEERIETILPHVTNAIIGDSTREDFLESLGIGNYDLAIVAIGDDFQSSLETTALLKEMGAKRVIARASRDVQAKFLARNGADAVIYPEKQMAEWTAMTYSADYLFDYFKMDDGYAVMEITVPKKWQGKRLGDLDVRSTYNINILAIKHSDTFSMEMSKETVFHGHEKILVLGKEEDIQRSIGL